MEINISFVKNIRYYKIYLNRYLLLILNICVFLTVKHIFLKCKSYEKDGRDAGLSDQLSQLLNPDPPTLNVSYNLFIIQN